MKNSSSPFNPKVDVFMPLYVGRYLQDTTELDATESGGYLHLLMYQWVSGPLPNNDSKLARIAKMTPDAWSIAKASVMHFMFLGPDGLWHQRALDKIKAEWIDKRQKAHDKAVNAARARWSKQKANKSHASSIASAMPYTGKEQVQEQNQTPPTPPQLRQGGPDAAQPGVLQASRPAGKAPAPAAIATSSRNGKRSKSETPGNNPRTHRDGLGAGKHPKKSSAGVAVPPKFVAPQSTNGVGPSKTDPRELAFQKEVFAYWRGQNPEHPNCPWGEPESRALKALLIRVPDLSLEQLRRALRNRAASGIPPGVYPGKWLRNVLDYSDGPLDRFHRPLRTTRVM